MKTDPRITIAAQNNADLYQAMFDAHGVAYQRFPYAFVGQDRPPPFYSNMTVLMDGHQDEIRAHLKGLANRFQGRVGLKDSFANLDLSSAGFRVLFNANWIWRTPQPDAMPTGWTVTNDVTTLTKWEAAWGATSPAPIQMFPAALLERSDFKFLYRAENGQVHAGCIANVSENCVGISNVFGPPQGPTFAQATAAISLLHPDLPIVGYESGDDIKHALAAGFDTIGDLRILVADNAQL